MKPNKHDNSSFTDTSQLDRKITIVFHAYHLALAKQIFVWIEEFAVKADLPVNVIITTPTKNLSKVQKLATSTTYVSEVLEVENHGRDIWPFLQVCQSGKLANSLLVLKIHTKAPRKIARGVLLNEESVHELLNPNFLPRLLRQANDDSLFVATLDKYVGRTDSWGLNISKYFQVIKKLNLTTAPKKLRFPAGTIFWTTGAFTQLLGKLEIDRNDFEGEPSPDDGAIEHVLERLFGMIAKENGGVIPLERLVTGEQNANRNFRN